LCSKDFTLSTFDVIIILTSTKQGSKIMAKATHYGICQVCGSRQKLPNGVLAKHGYSVEYGFFNGVCFGAHHLPFEQSKDLVDRDIARCRQEIDRIAAYAALIRASTTTIWIHEYRPATWEIRRSSYVWVEHDVDKVEISGMRITFTNGLGKPDRHDYYFSEKESLELYSVNEGAARDELRIKLTVRHMNEKRAQSLEAVIRSLENHITWQEIRIKDWEPKALDPINPVA
jgi:hypothetical protein